MGSSSLKGFKFELQRSFSPNDQQWAYTVPGLPPAAATNGCGLIKVISVISNASEQRMTLTLGNHTANRAIDRSILDRYVSISFQGFRLHYPAGQNKSNHGTSKFQPAPPKESSDYMHRLLNEGISINSISYSFYGHSNSQLKNQSCFLYAGSKEEAAQKIESMADFTKIKSIAKMVKRIGLLFSSAVVALHLPPDRCKDIADVERDGYIFTDGCGLISTQLARRFVKLLNIRFRAARYTPSVFQIRYRGYKGVLTLDPTLQGQIQVKFRKSMKKINVKGDLSFAVVEYSKPYSFGFLNDEVVLLLHALGIPASTFVLKQQKHLEFLRSALHDPQMTFRFLSYINEPQLAERVLMEGLDAVKPTVQGHVNREYGKMLNKRTEQRCRILVPSSRLVFGVCDPCNVLKEGECAVRVTMAGDGVAKTIVGTEVLVTRNPCLHPGDLQKFKATQHAELAHLVDCIVFPTKGRRPSADMMSGGDLDGDKFFVCWDSDLIPSTIAQAAVYPGGREPVSFKKITHDDRLAYFARYTNASVGRVKSLHTDWARLKGPMSSECQELNHLYSKCVDGNRISIPPHLLDPPKPGPEVGDFIIDTIHKAAETSLATARPLNDVDMLSAEGPGLFLSRDETAFSEFEMFKMTARWCDHNRAPLRDWLEFFDFNQMSDEERAWALAQMPIEMGTAALIMNALLRSSLLSQPELRYFNLDLPRVKWKSLYDTSEDRLGRLMDVFGTAMELFHRKLLVLRIDTRLTIALYIPRRIAKYEECVVDETVRLFSFPHSQGETTAYRRTLPTKMTYRLYFDDRGFQLYERQRANTWIFVNRPGSDDMFYKSLENKGEKRRARHATIEMGSNHDLVISVALNKFSAGLARHVGRVNRNPIIAAELYVISNRDTRSLQVLDQWLDLIDTQEVLPLFNKDELEYRLPTLKDMDWSTVPDPIRAIAQDGKLSSLPSMSLTDILATFYWLEEHNQKTTLRNAYKKLLDAYTTVGRRAPDVTILERMIDFLTKAPTLVVTFVDLGPWEDLGVAVRTLLNDRSETLLKALACVANDMQILVVEPYRKILSQIPHLSLQSLGSIIEHISLVVRSPEIALDLLTGCLELESPRVLTARPTLTHYFVKNCIGIAMEHISEAAESRSVREDLLELRLDSATGFVKSRLRVDSHSKVRFATNDHVQLSASTLPSNSLETRTYSMDALIENSEPAKVTLRCLHPLPIFLESCRWQAKHCGSFVTSKAMFDALNNLATSPKQFCPLSDRLLGIHDDYMNDEGDLQSVTLPPETLNESQKEAVTTALRSPLTCIWGPPGTGKTHTIAVILEKLAQNQGWRILVAAPTHNAVDNIMRKFLGNTKFQGEGGLKALRVSTDVRKVAEDLRQHTCDAMLGKDLNENPAGRKKAQKQIKDCRLVFTTCLGAGLGLLRSETFDIVVIDEASQQTEPQALVALTKGCFKAILVGDHVQLGATVSLQAEALGFEQSLFERLYRSPEDEERLRKVMLDTQYRMHASICDFSSSEFYDARLKTALQDSDRPLLPVSFPWPSRTEGSRERVFFVQCDSPEDLGRKSKSNAGQASLTHDICQSLQAKPSGVNGSASPSIAVLTPYSRQVELLQSLQSSSVVVNSIDGFQGREADIVVFVTTRCNPNGDIGFLKDLRRLNVVMTRARSACIIIGDRATLVGGDKDEKSTQVWTRLLNSLTPLPYGNI